MKLANIPAKRINFPGFRSSIAFITGLFFLFLFSCQEKEWDLYDQENIERIDANLFPEFSQNSCVLYYGHQTFTRLQGEPFTETQVIENPDFNLFNDVFALKILNGGGDRSKVSSAEIRIDGVLIAKPSDFSKKVILITKKIKNLTAESVLEVKLKGAPGSFIELWIEGTLKDGEPTNTISDIEGNVYKTIVLGTQEWMAENLRTTRYNNGELIGSTDPSTLDIEQEINPKYQWAYDGDENNVASLGRLYTWHAVTDNRKICPAGWHVPTDAEWTTFTDFLSNNGYGYNGIEINIGKSIAATSGWELYTGEDNVSTDQENNNSSGFTGVPAGYRIPSGSFSNLDADAIWWTSTENGLYDGWVRSISHYRADVSKDALQKGDGLSVRCLKNITTQGTLPTVTTAPVSDISAEQASSGGAIIDNGGVQITSQGICWSSSHTPTLKDNIAVNEDGTSEFFSWMTGLEPDVTYMVRAYATNSAGTAYGEEISFTTLPQTTGTVSDAEGNSYKTVEIGSQVWMAENLKSTLFNDGQAIPLVAGGTDWVELSTPGFSWYNNDAVTYKNDYGALYNWYAVSTDNLCPTGWHVPSEADWITMSNFLGGECEAGIRLKEPGTSHWLSPNAGSTNESGFTALPGGYRSPAYGDYNEVRASGYFWSVNDEDETNARLSLLTYDYECFLLSSAHKGNGFSVRCVKD